MKMYRVVSYVLPLNGEFENASELKSIIECNKYPEFHDVAEIKEADIGEWSDDHPCNKTSTNKEEYFK